jgi:hypothetical protein
MKTSRRFGTHYICHHYSSPYPNIKSRSLVQCASRESLSFRIVKELWKRCVKENEWARSRRTEIFANEGLHALYCWFVVALEYYYFIIEQKDKVMLTFAHNEGKLQSGGIIVECHPFLTTTLDRGECLASRSSQFTSGKTPPPPHLIPWASEPVWIIWRRA